METASPKQIDYCLDLFRETGYKADFVHEGHYFIAGIPFDPRFKDSPVRGWIEGLDRRTVSRMIDRLRDEIAENAEDDDD